MNWIEVPAGKYTFVDKEKRKSTCQIEIDVPYVISTWRITTLTNTTHRYDAFISHAPEGKWSSLAPLRVLSFDIECAGRKGVFPEADKDPIIQIANMVTRQGKHQLISLGNAKSF